MAQSSPAAEPTVLPAVVVGAKAEENRALSALKEPNQTGSRLGLTPRETPAAVDIIMQETMQAEGLRNTIEVYRSAPGVSSGNLPGEPGMTSMRGFSSSAIQYLFDGMRASDSAMMSRNFDSWNFEKIEILKGPASVMHGTGALAGAINLVTKKPSFEGNRYESLLSFGSFDSLRAGVGANVRLNDAAALRADLSYSRSDGWVDETDSRTTALTTGIALRPTDRLSITASFDIYQDDLRTPYQGLPLLPASVARDPSSIVSGAGGLVVDKAIKDRNYNVSDGVMKSDSYWLRTKLDYQLDDRWKLTNELSYYDADRRWKNSEDYTFSASTGLLNRTTTKIDHDHRFWAERLYAAFDGRLGGMRNRFTGGVEYNDTDFGTIRRFGQTTAVDPFAPDRGSFPDDTAANFPGAGNRVNFDSKVKTTAAFVEDALNLTPEWLAVIGVRQDHIELNRRIDDLNSGTSTLFGRNFNSTSWRVGTVYDLSPTTQIYAQYNRATAPIATLLLSNLARAAFDLSKGKSVEAGLKSAFLQERAVFTASAFKIEQDNILTRDPANPSLTVQGGSREAKGIELDFSLAVTPQWQVGANAAFIDSEFTQLIEAGGANRAGNRPPNVTNRVFNLDTKYRFAELPLTLGTALRSVGDFFTDNANTVRVKGHTVIDASISYKFASSTLTLRGRNLTDRFYADWSGYSTTQVYIAAPRSVDLTWTAQF
ncbi:MAG: TonB-dependent siderophore receptor [Candidatus Methylophosphatis roskildensis]